MTSFSLCTGSSQSSGRGGGVLVASNGNFLKLPKDESVYNSGIIYGSNTIENNENGVPLKNTASRDSNGHTIYFSTTKKRNITAGETDYIDTSIGKGLSPNGQPPFGQ